MSENYLDNKTFIKQNADGGDPVAQLQWAIRCLNGSNKECNIPIKERVAETITWLKKSSEQNYVDAQLILGNIYYIYCDNKEEAYKWWKKAAEQKDVRAIIRVAECLLNGEVADKTSIEDAIKHYKKVCPDIDIALIFANKILPQG